MACWLPCPPLGGAPGGAAGEPADAAVPAGAAYRSAAAADAPREGGGAQQPYPAREAVRESASARV